METVKVQHAKTHLSALLARVAEGEIIEIARGDHPIARLVPLGTTQRQLGFGGLVVPDGVLDGLPEEELAAWEQA